MDGTENHGTKADLENGYADSLRQQARWVREALDPSTPDTQRITMDDIDVDELEAAADEIERLQKIAWRNDLLMGITEENRHCEVSTGLAVGNEGAD